MKKATLLLLLSIVGYCAWFHTRAHHAVLERLSEDGVLASKAEAKVLFSSSIFREAESVIESRWNFVRLGEPEGRVKYKQFSYQEGLQSPFTGELLNDLSSYGFGGAWETAKLYSGEGANLLSKFLVVRFSDDRVLIWYKVF